MKISILIPARNEEMSIRKCIDSCLNQIRRADQILFINDGSTDKTGEILASYGNLLDVHTFEKPSGNKSFAQEEGLKYVTGDIVVMSDADSVLDSKFVETVEKRFDNPEIAAVAGRVQSLKHNWLTACRAIEYTMSQYIHKVAQNHIGYIFVLPGAAVAFRTSILKDIKFKHSTVCEDLDITYILNEQGKMLVYDTKAVVRTSDPYTIGSYISQIRRWHVGGAECLRDHWQILFRNPRAAVEVSLIYFSTIISAFLLVLLPLISMKFFLMYIVTAFLVFALFCATISAIVDRRPLLILYSIPFMLIIVLNNYVIAESIFKVFFRKRTQMAWVSPKRYLLKEDIIPV